MGIFQAVGGVFRTRRGSAIKGASADSHQPPQLSSQQERKAQALMTTTPTTTIAAEAELTLIQRRSFGPPPIFAMTNDGRSRSEHTDQHRSHHRQSKSAPSRSTTFNTSDMTASTTSSAAGLQSIPCPYTPSSNHNFRLSGSFANETDAVVTSVAHLAHNDPITTPRAVDAAASAAEGAVVLSCSPLSDDEFSPITSASETRPHRRPTLLMLNRTLSSSSSSSSLSSLSDPRTKSSVTFRPRIFHQRQIRKATMVPIEINCHDDDDPHHRHRHNHHHHHHHHQQQQQRQRSKCFINDKTMTEYSSALQSAAKNDGPEKDTDDDVAENMTNRQFVIFCLDLLENPTKFDDNRIGIERLLVLVNDELVNSKIQGGIAEMLIFGHESHGSSGIIDSSSSSSSSSGNSSMVAARLQSVFTSYLCDEDKIKKEQEGLVDDDNDVADENELDRASDRKASSTSTSNDDNNKIHTFKYLDGSLSTEETESITSSTDDLSATRESSSSSTVMRLRRKILKLPALRVLVSSLELAARNRSRLFSSNNEENTNNSSLNLTINRFWILILWGLVDCLECSGICDNGDGNGVHTNTSSSCTTSNCMEATLAVKAVRLLHGLDKSSFEPYIRDKLLPFISNISRLGQPSRIANNSKSNGTSRLQRPGDKMLMRECDKLLKVLM